MSSLNANSGAVAVTTQAKYNLVQPTYADGNATELQADASGNLRVTFSGTNSANIAQVNGNTALAGNGVTGTGSLRVTIASDNTAFSVNAVQSGNWAVRLQDGSGSAVNLGQAAMAASLPVVLANNQSALPSNISQVNGNTALAGNGVTGTGSLRVTIASDNTAFSIKLQDGAGSAVNKGQTNMAGSLPVTLASDQPALASNISQINGVTALAGNGVTGTGSLRVTIASDNTAFSIKLQDGAGSAVNKGQTTMSGSLPVTIASDQTALPASYVTVKNFLDTNQVLDTSVTTINGNAGAFVQVVASLGNACKKIRIADTTGQFIGVYTGGAGSEALAFIINPGMDDYIEFAIAASTRVSLRAMATGSITSGMLCLQFSA